MVAGLNTIIMMGEEKIIDYSPYKIALVKTKNDFLKSEFKKNINTFEVLKHILDEIISLSSLRLDVITHQKSPNYALEIKEMEKKKNEYKELLYILEESNIGEIKKELRIIKDQEIENGVKEGKKRKFFPKDSPEYLRKKELKLLIEKYKNKNEEYKQTYNEYKAIESSLDKSVVGVTQYDSSISALFIRFSDNINSILKNIKVNQNNGNYVNTHTLPSIELKNNTIRVSIESVSKEEEVMFNIILNYLISNPNGKQSTISDSKIITIVEESGKLFSMQEESTTECGQLILSTLREFWLYKNQQNDSFSIPEHLPLLQAIMSFLIKPRGFDQIERFMLNKRFQLKKYAFLLWGCLIGYAAIPKTLTNILNDKSQENLLDNFLYKINKTLSNMISNK